MHLFAWSLFRGDFCIIYWLICDARFDKYIFQPDRGECAIHTLLTKSELDSEVGPKYSHYGDRQYTWLQKTTNLRSRRLQTCILYQHHLLYSASPTFISSSLEFQYPHPNWLDRKELSFSRRNEGDDHGRDVLVMVLKMLGC